MAVFIERGLQHILQRLRIGDLLKPVHTLVIVEAILFHADHRLVARLRSCARSTCFGSSNVASTMDITSNAYVSDSGVEQFQRGQQERA